MVAPSESKRLSCSDDDTSVVSHVRFAIEYVFFLIFVDVGRTHCSIISQIVHSYCRLRTPPPDPRIPGLARPRTAHLRDHTYFQVRQQQPLLIMLR